MKPLCSRCTLLSQSGVTRGGSSRGPFFLGKGLNHQGRMRGTQLCPGVVGKCGHGPADCELRVRPRLLGNLARPGHFLSFAEWESREAIERFRTRPNFAQAIAAIQEHAEFAISMLQESA